MLLVACSQGTKQTQTPSVPKADHHVRLVVKEDTNTIDEKVSFGKGDTVLEILKDNYEVKEKMALSLLLMVLSKTRKLTNTGFLR